MVGLKFSQAFAVSADGLTVVGYRHIHSGIVGAAEPVLWTEQDGVRGLGNSAGYTSGDACGANADGSVVVGNYNTDATGDGMAFRWTQSSGIARLEHLPETSVDVEANAIVGEVRYADRHSAAFCWTQQRFVELGTLPGHMRSITRAVSADGSVVVGWSESPDRCEAFRWTKETGMVGLGTPRRQSQQYGVRRLRRRIDHRGT
jgi:probable HAF family extracellular repeat protein